jgi:hypothetical protein
MFKYLVNVSLYSQDKDLEVIVSTEAKAGVNCDQDFFQSEIEDELIKMGIVDAELDDLAQADVLEEIE